MQRPEVRPSFSSAGGKSAKAKPGKGGLIKKAVVIGVIGLGAAIGWHMLPDNDAPDPNTNSQQAYEEKRDQQLNVFHSVTRDIIDDYAANMADIMDASRAGQYRSDLEGSMEQLLEEALIHDATEVRAPIRTAMGDKTAISIARKWDFKVVFDDQLEEYGAVYHPANKVVAINANVPLPQAAVYARNALHHISGLMFSNTNALEQPFAIDITSQTIGSVTDSVLDGDELPRNFKPPAPPIKSGPGS